MSSSRKQLRTRVVGEHYDNDDNYLTGFFNKDSLQHAGP